MARRFPERGGPGAPAVGEIARRLRLIVVTDAEMVLPRSVEEVVEIALDAGAPAVQLRDKNAPSGELLETARRLRRLTADAGALFFVNDRVDIALAAGADGVHLGPDDLPVSAVRRVVPTGFLIGHSTDDTERARHASEEGADYIGCGAVFGSTTKDVRGEVIGTAGLDRVARAVDIPVVGIGGVTPGGAAEVARTAAVGVAVVGAVMGASDPGDAVRRLLAPFGPT